MWLLARKSRLDHAVVYISGALFLAAMVTLLAIARGPTDEGTIRVGVMLLVASGAICIGYAVFCLLWSVYLAVLWGIDRYRYGPTACTSASLKS